MKVNQSQELSTRPTETLRAAEAVGVSGLVCFHCGAATELRCSDCAIENSLTREGLPICTRRECRDKHDEWHTRPTPIAELENALNHGAEVTILPNGRVIAKASESDEKPLTFRQDLGGEYASNQTYLEATEGECAEGPQVARLGRQPDGQ